MPKELVLDGFDMRAVLRGESQTPREEMFWERRGERAARVGQWKLIQTKEETTLYDLSVDIGERRNLIEERPEAAAMVRKRLKNWQQQMADAEPRGPFRDF